MDQNNQNQKNKLIKSFIVIPNENLFRQKDYSQYINTNIPINEEIYVKKNFK